MVDISRTKDFAKGIGGGFGQLDPIDLVLDVGVVAANKCLAKGALYNPGGSRCNKLREGNVLSLWQVLNLFAADFGATARDVVEQRFAMAHHGDGFLFG